MAQTSKRRYMSSSLDDDHAPRTTFEQQVAANGEELRIQGENAKLLSQLSTAQLEGGRLGQMVRYLQAENESLKGRLEQQHLVNSLAATKPVGFSELSIEQGFELIATDLWDACLSVDIAIPPTSHGTSAKTETWAQRVAQRSFSRLLASATDPDIDDFHIAGALAAASISDLVLESRFPNFLSWQSPLLDEYRRHVLTRSKLAPLCLPSTHFKVTVTN